MTAPSPPPKGLWRVRQFGARHQLLAWAAAYLGVTLLPLFVISVGTVRPSRGFWVEFGVAVGFVGLAMLGLQSILTARFSRFSASIGQDTLLQFHRQAGVVAFVLIAAHPEILLTANWANRSFLDPRVNLVRAVALWFVFVALPTLIVTSLMAQATASPVPMVAAWSRGRRCDGRARRAGPHRPRALLP